MDDKQDKAIPSKETASSAYRDALYSQAPEERRNSYGYNPAQCYARVREDGDGDEAGRKSRGGALVAVTAGLIVCVIVAALLGSGGLFLSHRAAAAGDEPTREIYEDYSAAADEADPEESLDLAVAEGEALPELSAEEIYETACASTVGVTIPGYAQNIFGQPSPSSVTGSGIVLDEDGYILTNYHVIDPAYSQGLPIRVITYEGEEYDASVVGVETDSDLAVLQIEAPGLVPARLGDSDGLRVGQTIYAVGNPLGELTYTMTSGIVSALNRRVTTDENITVNMFQIDAAVNNGNSGGPVFDVYGQVIGVVTAKYSLGGLEGLGFAIPIGDACDIARDLVEKGYVTGKAYLGLTMATVSPSVAKYYDMVQGVYVYDVEEGSCAEEAGLTAGDIITAIDGESVLRSSDLAKAVKLYRAGDSAVLTVYREPEYIEVTVVFDEELPAGAAAPTTEAAGGATGDMTVRES